jgi:inorganic phosphate transporter, PiT family
MNQNVAAAHHPLASHPTPGKLPLMLFGAVVIVALAYIAVSLTGDLSTTRDTSWLPFVLLGIALLIALGFEFVNGFHDTANAVATVIYTHSLAPNTAVVWSGFWNFLGVMASSGAVAYGIISLLPVELILQVGSGAGFAMVFALLIAAIIWNLGTWYLGLPASSSHTLIGSIIGVGLANQLLATSGTATSGVDWNQALNIGKSLLFSPIIGFAAAAMLLVTLKFLVRNPALFKAPQGKKPPPLWIRSILVLTCTGVSFAHGSNDGQKGMGLIMLILIGTVPTVYALNRAMEPERIQAFSGDGQAVAQVLSSRLGAQPPAAISEEEARARVATFVRSRTFEPATLPALIQMVHSIDSQVASYKSFSSVPTEKVSNVRNDMYLVSEAFRYLLKLKPIAMNGDEEKVIKTYRGGLDHATKFIPTWVKVAVALALGLGTMVGWKRIVVTVGEKIGKSHLTYGQGASAELVAMTTIGAADLLGLPVSTTQVLSSGVAGTMAANGSGLQWATVRNLLLAWVLTLPASVLLSGCLFWLFRFLF